MLSNIFEMNFTSCYNNTITEYMFCLEKTGKTIALIRYYYMEK